MSSTNVARELIWQLCAAGVRDVVLAPGSRSAPLAYACADAEAAGLLTAHVRVDERTAGFYALGLTKAGSLAGRPRPVVVVTTSGTAVANLHPAVLEAAHTGMPLLVLSADRPHEWRGTGANQTTSQPGIYGDAVRWASELPARVNPASIRGHVARAVAAALGTVTRDPGPVQVNVGFAEPLVPDARWDVPALPAQLVADGVPEGPFVPDATAPVSVAPASAPVPVVLPAGRRTLAVAGDAAGPDAARVALAAGWPLLAEPSSGARLPGAIAHYQALLRDDAAADAERVVVFGHPTLSRSISSLLGRADLEIVVVSPTARWTDVMGRATAVVSAVEAQAPTASDREWLNRWQDADAIPAAYSPMQRAALALWDADGVLVLGSSNTVRAFDAVAPGSQRAARVVANRGLAGIDGLISTAHGIAAGLGEPVKVVVGDLSFVHDIGGLGRGEHEPEPDLDVIVLNDHGGGIFAGLEHARAPRPVFERFFATPQVLNVSGIADGLGVHYSRAEVDDLAAALASKQHGRRVLEVPLPRV